MNKETAILILAERRKLMDITNTLGEIADTINDSSERIATREHIAEVIISCEDHLVAPILRLFPDLNPAFTGQG